MGYERNPDARCVERNLRNSPVKAGICHTKCEDPFE